MKKCAEESGFEEQIISTSCLLICRPSCDIPCMETVWKKAARTIAAAVPATYADIPNK
jgi:hypothetical protein